MKIPKERRTYCPSCKKHTVHEVFESKRRKPSELKWGQRQFRRVTSGYRGYPIIPALITAFAIAWFFRLVDGILEPVYFRILGYHTPGLGFVSAIILVFIVGIISTNVFGKKIILFFERIILNIPVFRSFYTAV